MQQSTQSSLLKSEISLTSASLKTSKFEGFKGEDEGASFWLRSSPFEGFEGFQDFKAENVPFDTESLLREGLWMLLDTVSALFRALVLVYSGAWPLPSLLPLPPSKPLPGSSFPFSVQAPQTAQNRPSIGSTNGKTGPEG